jgi:hypothetical protein
LSFSQPKIYEATAIFLVRPHTDPNIQDDFVKVLDIISRLSVINNTFAEVATSNQIKQLAFSSLALPAQKRKGLSVNAPMEITIQGQIRSWFEILRTWSG